MDVPTTSPYYDRLESLKRQLQEAKPATPEYKWIDAQIYELTSRAWRRVSTAIRTKKR